MKTTEPGASTKWREWSCRTGNAGRWGQDARWHTLIDWLNTSHNLAEIHAHVDCILLCNCVNMGLSLLEKHQDVSESDFPLPLAAIDTERERLIFEKDEEVRVSYCLTHSFTRVQREQLLLHLFPSVAEEDAGGAGEDSGADAARPERWLLILLEHGSNSCWGSRPKNMNTQILHRRLLRWSQEKHVPALSSHRLSVLFKRWTEILCRHN